MSASVSSLCVYEKIGPLVSFHNGDFLWQKLLHTSTRTIYPVIHTYEYISSKSYRFILYNTLAFPQTKAFARIQYCKVFTIVICGCKKTC